MEKYSDIAAIQSALQEPVSILYISMPDCSVCVAVKPRLEKLAQDLAVPLYQMDAFEVPEVAGEFQVMTAPAVLVFSKGKELQRQARFINFEKISSLVEDLQASDTSVDYETLFK